MRDLAIAVDGPDRSTSRAQVRPHRRGLPLRVGTRGSPLAMVQTRAFLDVLRRFCPVLRDMNAFEEHVIRTTGDVTQASGQRLADIGGKGLFAKEIHEALVDGRIDFAVHSLKDLESELPPGIALACTLPREDPRDVLVVGPGLQPGDGDPLDCLPLGALVGSASVRRQAQLLDRRRDLRITTIRGNVQTRLDRVADETYQATLLAMAGLRRLRISIRNIVPLDVNEMVPSPCQGIVGITVRSCDEELRELLAAIEEPEARIVATAERAFTGALDGSCRTPIGGYAHVTEAGRLHLQGLVARADGSFLLRSAASASVSEAAELGRELGAQLRARSPADIFS